MRTITPYTIAQAFLGVKEVPGVLNNPVIVSMLQIDHPGQALADEVAWCSAFMNAVAKLAGCQRTRSLAARSWLIIGDAITVDAAEIGWDVVVLKRGGGGQPGPSVLQAQGHVGMFAGWDTSVVDDRRIRVLGGNQSNSVSIATFPVSQVLAVRRLS